MRSTACAFLFLGLSLMAFGDSITIDGTRYEDVLVRESPSRYYVWIPAENRTLSVAKEKAQDVALTQDPIARGKLIQAWAESEQKRAAQELANPPEPAPTSETGDTPSKNTTATEMVRGTSNATSTQADPDAQAIVDAYTKQQDRIQAFTVHYVASYSGQHQLNGEGGNSAAQAERCHDGWFSQDFRRNRHTQNERQWVPHTKWTRERAGLMLWQWDGTVQCQYSEERREGTICRGNDPVVRDLTEHPLQGLCRAFMGKDLMGYPTQDELRIDKRLAGSPLVLRPEVETVGTFKCRVVEAQTPFGYITAWFVPDKGHSLIRCAIDKGRDSVYEGAHIEVVVDELQEVDGLWLPKSGRAKEDWRMLDGGFISRETSVTLDSFTINPDFDKDGTFDLTKHVADGSTWRYFDSQEVAYRWEQGKLVPVR